MRKACGVALWFTLPACGSSDPARSESARDAGFFEEHEPADGSVIRAEAGREHDAGPPVWQANAGHDAGTSEYATRPLSKPPDYQGSQHNGVACNTTYPTVGFEPVTGGNSRHPLFLYFVGTAFNRAAPNNQHDNIAATTVAEAMARRGFVALSAAYDNSVLTWLSDHLNQLRCLFEEPAGLLARACAMPQVDCSLGVATWGHSQGGLVAMMAANYDERVRAAWATGYGGDGDVMLSRHRMRVVNGEADATSGTPSVLNAITGLSSAVCSDDQCLRDNGSGWIIVRKSDLADPAISTADHCWFDRRSCGDSVLALEPTWVDPSSTRAYALEPNAEWLANTARRTDLP